MEKLAWNPAYVPGDFDKLRERTKETKKNAHSAVLKIIGYFSGLIFVIALVWANKTFAMDTVTNADLTKSNCGWDVCQNNGTK